MCQVMLCTNYEEAQDIFSRYADNVLGVISDFGFPKVSCSLFARYSLPLLPFPSLPPLSHNDSCNAITTNYATYCRSFAYSLSADALTPRSLCTFSLSPTLLHPLPFAATCLSLLCSGRDSRQRGRPEFSARSEGAQCRGACADAILSEGAPASPAPRSCLNRCLLFPTRGILPCSSANPHPPDESSPTSN